MNFWQLWSCKLDCRGPDGTFDTHIGIYLFYIQGVSKKMVICYFRWFFWILYIENTYLFALHNKYQPILCYPQLYSFLRDEKLAYGKNFDITHHKDQHFIFLKIFLKFTKFFFFQKNLISQQEENIIIGVMAFYKMPFFKTCTPAVIPQPKHKSKQTNK